MSQSPSPTSTPPPSTTLAPGNVYLSALTGVSPNGTEAKTPLHHPKLAFAGTSGSDGRRPSVQFAAGSSDRSSRTASPRPCPPKSQKKRSSPPPPLNYESRVSFDTFDNRDATDYSITLSSKHKDYAYTNHSRTFLCGTDQNDYSEFALEWLIDELVEDGDEIVCLRVVDPGSKINSDASVQQGKYKSEAHKMLEQIKAKNKDDEKSINLILEYAVGKVPETIQRMITIYAPACLIVGTRGRSLGGLQSLLPGSVSKYCLQNSPVPVVVVRPSAKREKKKRKRLADPNRKTYMGIMKESGASGSQVLNKDEMDKLVGHSGGKASEHEALAVAEAIGLPGNLGAFAAYRKERNLGKDEDGEPLSRVTSAKSDYTSEPETPSPTGYLTPDPPLPGEMRSPNFERLESPAMSEEEDAAVGEASEEEELASRGPLDLAGNGNLEEKLKDLSLEVNRADDT